MSACEILTKMFEINPAKFASAQQKCNEPNVEGTH